MLTFLALILENKSKDLFLVRLGSALLIGKLSLGVGAKILTPFVAGFIGLIYESGVYKIDLTLDALKEGMERKEFRFEARKAYNHAKSKVHTEEEKQKIREQYLVIIGKFSSL